MGLKGEGGIYRRGEREREGTRMGYEPVISRKHVGDRVGSGRGPGGGDQTRVGAASEVCACRYPTPGCDSVTAYVISLGHTWWRAGAVAGPTSSAPVSS